MKLRFIIEVLLFALMTFSCVWSADVVAAQVGYYSTDDVALRTDMIVKLRGYLLNALRNYFAGSEECSDPEPFPHQTLDTNHEQKQWNVSFGLPADVLGLIEKYLERKDVYYFMLLSRGANAAMNEGIKLNLSAFCPEFVFTHDFRLSRLFYLALIKDLHVVSIKDERMIDKIQLLSIRRIHEDLQTPKPKHISPMIFDQMFMCLSEAVNGFNYKLPLSINSQIISFSDVFMHYDLPKTFEYIQNNSEDCKNYKMELLKFFKSNPSCDEVDNDVRIANFSVTNDETNPYVLANIVHNKLTSLALGTPAEHFLEALKEIFGELLQMGFFDAVFFDKICENGGMKGLEFIIWESYHLKAITALLETDPDHLSFMTHYALTRSSTTPFDIDHFLSLTGNESSHHTIFKTLLNAQSLNLADIDVLSKIVRSGIIDLTSLTAPNRSSLLLRLLKCSKYHHNLLDMILNEIPGAAYLNLFGCIASTSTSTRTELFPLLNVQHELFDSFALKVIMQYFIAKCDDPLPILFFPLRQIEGAESLIQDKFDLNKKYVFDYDFDLLVYPFKFMEFMAKADVSKLKGTVMDFKTIVQKISFYMSTSDLKSYFTSKPGIFNEPTPSNIKPISLKRYFEDGVFEEV